MVFVGCFLTLVLLVSPYCIESFTTILRHDRLAQTTISSPVHQCSSIYDIKNQIKTSTPTIRLNIDIYLTATTTSLRAVGGIVDKLLGFVNNNENNNNENNNNNSKKLIINIDASLIKVGALRFLLNIHLVGEQNNPIPKAWLIQEASDSKNEIDVYYYDGTGMLSIIIKENNIQMIRNGIKPSLQYQLHESLLIHNVLDEIQTCAYGDESISKEKRLIQLNNDNAIELARSTLPVRKG